MKCKLCKDEINDKATKCQHCRGWQSITGLISKKMEYGLMAIVFSIMIIPVTYMANDAFKEKFSELNYTARFMVLSEYAEDTNASSYDDYQVNTLNHYQLRSRYDEIIEKDGDITLRFESDLSKHAIQYISKLAMHRKIINAYSYGDNKIKVNWT